MWAGDGHVTSGMETGELTCGALAPEGKDPGGVTEALPVAGEGREE